MNTLATPDTRIETDADGLALTLVDRGAGRPVLVLHGGGGPASVARFVETMSATHRVLAPTHPGFAGTPRPEAFDSIEQLAARYLELLERHALDDVLVMGFSMGGWIASELATRAGTRLRGVVLVDAAGIEVEGETCVDVFPLKPNELSALSLHDPAKYGIDPAALSPGQKAAMAANFQALAAYCQAREMRDPTLRARLAAVTTPALVAWGASDRIVTPAYGQAYAKAFADARFELIAECGHLPQVEQPARLLALVHGFDAALSATPR